MSLAKASLLPLLILFALSFGGNVAALDLSEKLVVPADNVVQMITLDDGSTLVGRITEVGADQIKFKTDLGEMTVDVVKIKDIREVSTSSFKNGQYWFPNPNATRLLIGPTARMLKAGQGYFADLWLFFPGAFYGLTDNISIGGGISIFPGVDEQLFYVVPKIGFKASEKTHLAASFYIFHLWDETACMAIGGMTYGTDDKSITGGIGLAVYDEGVADRPAATVGGEYRISRRISLVGESWFIPSELDEGELVMGAVRFFGESVSIDLGLAYAIDNKGNRNVEEDLDYEYSGYDTDYDATTWLPYIDFVYNF